jgi:WhiB family redox-sensing transcriptional regulator
MSARLGIAQGSHKPARNRRDTAWKDRAACAGSAVDFFPDERANPAPALQICRSCPVTRECLAYARKYKQAGIWGGMTEKQRKRRSKEPPTLKPCGTVAAFQRHVRRCETPCEACRDAKNRDQLSRRCWQGKVS